MNDQQQSRADALTEAQRKALETAVNVLNTNWEHETANELWEAFTAPSLQPAAAPKHWRDMPENIAILGVERGDSVECDGTFACPICGKGEPHEHSSAEVAQHHIDKQQPAPSPADERAAFEAWWTRDVPAEHKASAYALLKQFGDDYAANKRCAEAWEVWQARAASANETGAEGATALELLKLVADWVGTDLPVGLYKRVHATLAEHRSDSN